MEHIITVTGPIAPEALGDCQSHEHLCILPGRSAQRNPVLCIDRTEQTLAELADYARAGGRAVVDAQPVGCGRSAQVLAALSRESGVHIIASTGFHKLEFYPEEHWLRHWGAEELSALFVQELTCGMSPPCDEHPPEAPTDIVAGQIKTALDGEGLTPRYRTLFFAAADAAVRTGAPLMVHVEEGSDPLALADVLEGRGVDPRRMIFCHLDRAQADFGVHLALCRRGAALEYDTIGREKYHSDRREAELILAVLEAGFGDRLLLSLDVTRARLLHYGGQVGLCYLRNTFLPLLRACGVVEEVVEQMLRHNPARCFARSNCAPL